MKKGRMVISEFCRHCTKTRSGSLFIISDFVQLKQQLTFPSYLLKISGESFGRVLFVFGRGDVVSQLISNMENWSSIYLVQDKYEKHCGNGTGEETENTKSWKLKFIFISMKFEISCCEKDMRMKSSVHYWGTMSRKKRIFVIKITKHIEQE